MKKTTISISYDEEKLNAMKLYLGQKGSSIDTEFTKSLDILYSKTVPLDVREFISMKSEKNNVLSSSAVSDSKRESSQR